MTQLLVLSRGEDELHINLKSSEQFCKELEDGDYGRNPRFLDRVYSLDEFPSNSILVMKGDIIIPRKIEVATKYEIR